MTALNFKPVGTSSDLSKGGNGSFTPLTTGMDKAMMKTSNPFAKLKDERMDFKANRDPVFIAFDHLENQPVSKLAQDYVKENVQASINKMIKKFKKAF